MELTIRPYAAQGIEPQLARLMEDAVAAISELSGRISVTSVGAAWHRRAAWSGYARAMQLQGIEIDEVDLFSWGCGITLPGRARRSTASFEFAEFAPWQDTLRSGDLGSWKDTLPFTPSLSIALPRLLQAFDLQRQYAQRSGGIVAWLALPMFVHRLGLSKIPLPCLVAGTKAFRFASPLPIETLRASCKALAASAANGLEALDALETCYRSSVRAIRSEYRPSKLPELLAIILSTGLLTPVGVASDLNLSIAGASKLLERAAKLDLIVEISGRRSWKTYVAPDLAITFGYRRTPVGRPRNEPPPLPLSSDIAGVLDDFDRQMAQINEMLSRRPDPRAAPSEPI